MLLNINTRKLCALTLGVLLMTTVTACGGDDDPPQTGSTEMLRYEKYCGLEGVSEPLRHTFVIIDSAALEAAVDSDEFIKGNRWIRDAVLNLADPQNAIARSSSVVRERITILLSSEAGSAASPLFTGCIPGYTQDEISEKRNESGAVADFFGGGVSEEIESDTEAYRTLLVGALIDAGRKKASLADSNSGGRSASFLNSLNASVGLLDANASVPRFVLVTKVRNGAFSEDEPTRAKGIEAGRSVQSPFTGGDVMVVTEDTVSSDLRSYLEGYFLAQDSRLIYIGAADLGSLPSAPTTIYRFAGDATYHDGPGPVQIRLAVDENGELVSSWLFLRHGDESSVPIDGQAVCGDGQCSIRSVENGFSQIWSNAPGGEPEFSPEMPFGGLRNFEVTFDEQGLKGRIFDPLIDRVGPNPDDKDIPLSAQVAENAKF